MNEENSLTLNQFVAMRNHQKLVFTPGPGPLLHQNLAGLRNCFGRGDPEYGEIENSVLTHLRRLSGQTEVVRMQGSATLAIEVGFFNFLFGRVVIVDTGFYGHRLLELARSAQSLLGKISTIEFLSEDELFEIDGNRDWVVAVAVETSRAELLPISLLSEAASRVCARLFLDATASIGLEEGHELADVLAFSSCKGLFGLSGAAFLAFSIEPANDVPSFYLDLKTHVERKVTGPYHAVCSLYRVLPDHERFRAIVEAGKRSFVDQYGDSLCRPLSRQPNLCTHVSLGFREEEHLLLYQPRQAISGTIVCHLGELGVEITDGRFAWEVLRVE